MPKFNSFNRSLAFASLFVLAQPGLVTNAFAQTEQYTHYITDNLQVPMRRGAGVEYRIERMLNAGSPIKILETTDTGWSRVEYTSGNRTWEGWVNQVGIQSERPAKLQFTELSDKLKTVEARFKQLQTEHNSLKDQFKTTSSELEQVKQEKFELNKQLEEIKRVSGGSLELDRQNQDMRRQIGELETQNVIMREQIAQAEDTVKRQWFLTGAGVLLLGLLIGRFFKLPSRRSSWDKI